MSPNIDELYQQGTEAFNKGDYEKAENIFQEFLNARPDFADILNRMGIIYNQTNRLVLAVKTFQKALSINPAYTEASLNLAVTCGHLGRYDQARDALERAAAFVNRAGNAETPASGIDPFVKGKLADEHLRLGNMYHELRLLDEAIEEYQKALRLSPNFADIITRLGIAYRDKGNFDEAVRQFNRAMECNPKYTPARLHLGITYYSQGFYGLAAEEWKEALATDPDNAAVRTYVNFIKSADS